MSNHGPNFLHSRERWRRLLYLPIACAMLVLGGFVFSTPAHAAPGDFTDLLGASLAGAEETSPNESIATGRAVFAVTEGDGLTRDVYYRLSVSDIISVTGAHLHVGAAGADGPVLVDLLDGAELTPDSPVTGQFSLSVAEALVLLSEGMYVNVHTEAFGDGEIRGQVVTEQLPEARHAVLLGSNELPEPVMTDARGLARFEITASGEVSYTVDVADIEDVTAAHIHRGDRDTNGPVVFDLNGSGLTPGTPLTGTLQLGPQDVVDLVGGFFYVNVHTTENEDGEIRGQITGVSLFQADLTGAEEVPAVDTPATGRAVLGLNESGTVLDYRIVVREIEDIQAAHIHLGARGENGGVIQGLFPPGDFGVDEPLVGSATLTVENILDLIGERYYVNVHTTAFGDGEIRGQVMGYAPREYHHAILTGGEEVPPVETDALGQARMRLNAHDGMLHYTVFGRDLVGATAAHIHVGARGESGPVVFDLNGAGFGEGAPLGGAVELNAENMIDLLTGFYYVNVHTAVNGDGEIRGQVGGARPYQADLSGANEVPAAMSPASGHGIMALNDDATELSYHIAVTNLPTVTMAHIHAGEAGANGDVVVNFMPPTSFGPGEPISGTVAVSPDLVFSLTREALYVNVHTTDFGGGEVRGQIVPFVPEARSIALLDGSQESPAVESPSAGLARLVLDIQQSTATYELWVDAIEDVTGGHIHRGIRGQNGPVVFNLLASGRTLSETMPVGGGLHLSAQDWVDLLAGRFYVNVHTPTNPGGEVRGQLVHTPVFAAPLSGANEVPSVESIASGMGVLAVAPDGRSFAYRLAVEDIDDITMAHIHSGAAGTNGGVVVDFAPPESFGPGAPISGTVAITRSLAFDLARGGLYFNVHTDSHGGGEVRGQIMAYAPPSHYLATLTGADEVSPVMTDGAGVAWMRLDADNGYFHYGAAVRSIDGVEAAHIHSGASGENGPVAFGLFAAPDTFGPDSPISGGQVLSPMGLVNLLTGYYYVNVHTADHPDGELRGQVGGPALFEAGLAGANEVPVVESNALGRVVAALDRDARMMTLRAEVTELAATQGAHIHKGAMGVNGGVVVNLLANDGVLNESTPLRFTQGITLGQALDLIAGDYYVNVHTSAFPDGEVRGQLAAYTPVEHLHAGLTGGNEVPAVTTNAVGIARMRLNPVLGQTAYRIDVTDIADVSMGHIHRGASGINGPVTVNFGLTANELAPGEPVAGAAWLTGGDWVDILTGNAYVNIHTTGEPGGEIRGQLAVATPFQAMLTGEQEVPPVTTDAGGMAVLALRGDTAGLDYRVWVEDITGVTMAHIHSGVMGVNGGVARDLNGAGLAPGAPISGQVAADNALIFDLLRGRNYVNVHTATNPDGEIRGQIMGVTPETSFVVELTEEQEVAPSQTGPSGEAVLALDPFAGVLNYLVRVMNLPNIDAAHIHRGARGENGPVVFGLYDGTGPFDADNPIAGIVQLGSQDMVDLLSNFFYINVHTTEEPAGAIRGQIEADLTVMPPAVDLYVPQLERGVAAP